VPARLYDNRCTYRLERLETAVSLRSMSSRALRSIVFQMRLVFNIADERKYEKTSGVAGAKLEEENVDVQSIKHIQFTKRRLR